MTPDQERYRDMWLAEMGACVHEVPREDRAVERALAEAFPTSPRDRPQRRAAS